MKKYLRSQLMLIVPLLFVAGISAAAFTYTGPSSAPSAGNTEAPLDISTNDQVKNGGLSVNEFHVSGNSYFDQDSAFSGHIFGETNSDIVTFGTSANQIGRAHV